MRRPRSFRHFSGVTLRLPGASITNVWISPARQGDWQEVARLSDEAVASGLSPEDVSEWMPALEAYATLGRLPEMRRAAAIIRSQDGPRAFLCLQMQRGAAYPGPYDYNQVNQALCQAN